MIKPADKNELRSLGRFAATGLREFAAATLEEFLGVSKVGDVYEVTGFPVRDGQERAKAAERTAAELRSEGYYMGRRDEAKVYRRKDRVFLERRPPRR